jgi:hypothetical protein
MGVITKRVYSMTSSARASSVGGTVRPSARAVCHDMSDEDKRALIEYIKYF